MAIGLVLAVGGGQLALEGGPVYHFAAGVALMTAGILLWRRRPSGVIVYLLLFAATTSAWGLLRVGWDGWALIPWLVAPTVLLALVLGTLSVLAAPRRRLLALSGFGLGLTAIAILVGAFLRERLPESVQTRIAASGGGEWPAYGGATGGGQFQSASALAPRDLPRLRRVWTYRAAESASAPDIGMSSFEADPIVVDGRMYVSTGFAMIHAIDAATGRLLWRHDTGLRQRDFGQIASRGVSHWSGGGTGPCASRILYGTLDARLIALDALTGRPCAGFGEGGAVDLRAGVRLRATRDYYVTSPPVIVGDVAVVGSGVGDNRAVMLERGIVRGFDVVTGRLLWSWDPLPADPASASAQGWRLDQAVRTGAANAWAPLSADIGRGLVFVPTSSPSPDYFGGARSGANAHANSVVALRVGDGGLAWTRQLVHHDLWDYDTSSQPVLTTIRVGGRIRDIVVTASKAGFVFVLDRDTGEPVFPIEERAVPASDVPGETASPTQPFPPPAFRIAGHERLRAGDAWGFTPIDQMLCALKIARLRSEGVFTPPSARGSVTFPGYGGGLNWGGIAIDPGRQLAIMPVMDLAMTAAVVPREEWVRQRQEAKPDGPAEFSAMEGTPYGMSREPLVSPLGAPCVRPPWGRLVAIDLATGRRAWDRPLGTTGEVAPIALPLGSPVIGGAVATAGGVTFVGASTDARLRGFDSVTGRLLWEDRLPAPAISTPAIYVQGARTYVAVAAGGGGRLGANEGNTIVVYAVDAVR